MEIEDGVSSWDIHPKVVLMDYHRWQLNRYSHTGEANGFSTKLMIMTDHTGTHVDSQTHFFPEGNSIDQFPLGKFVGEAILLDVSNRNIDEPIRSSDLNRALTNTEEDIKHEDIIIIKAWPFDRTHPKFSSSPGFTSEAVDWLLNKKIKILATDLATVDFQDSSRPAHVKLLKENVLIMENLVNLNRIKQNRFSFIGLPLRLKEGTGSPIRAIALMDKI